MTKHLMVAISDLHVGSTVGLTPERFPLDDGGYYSPSRAQLWLLERWNEFWTDVKTAKRGKQLTVVINGDIVEGYGKFRKTQIATSSPESMEYVATELLKPVRKLADKMFFIRGTPSHVKSGAGAEDAVARAVGADKMSRSWSKIEQVFNVGGTRFHFSHHLGSSGGRLPWTRGTGVRSVALRYWANHVERNEIPADVVVRSHVHIFDDTPSSLPVYCCSTPAWCLANDFALKVGGQNEPLADVGGLLFHIREGEPFALEKKLYTAPLERDVTV